jgi:hypothetical protein
MGTVAFLAPIPIPMTNLIANNCYGESDRSRLYQGGTIFRGSTHLPGLGKTRSNGCSNKNDSGDEDFATSTKVVVEWINDERANETSVY